QARRHAGARRAVHESRLRDHDPQARRLAVRAVRQRDAHGDGHAALRGPAEPRHRADALHPAHHELRRQLRIAGDLAHHPPASAPFVATLVDVTGLVIYFSVAYLVLRGTLL